MKVRLIDLRAKVAASLAKLGYGEEDSRVIADVMLYAQLRGNSQGIVKIGAGGIPKAEELEPYKVVRQNKCGTLLSGGHPMATTAKAATIAVELAAEHGVGVVGSNHTFASSGAIGYYSRQIAKAGYIGFVCTGNGGFAVVAPYGSAERKFGTNPFSYAFPYNGGEVVFDNATSAIAWYSVVEAKMSGKQLPEGVGFDKDGQPSTDPAAVLEGSIAPFAGHKGFGLSLFVQLLGSAFTLAGISGAHEEDGWGIFVMAIDPGLLAGKDEFMQRATELVEHVQSAKPLPGQKVVLPGEHGDALAKQAEDSGKIEIADGIWDGLLAFVEK